MTGKKLIWDFNPFIGACRPVLPTTTPSGLAFELSQWLWGAFFGFAVVPSLGTVSPFREAWELAYKHPEQTVAHNQAGLQIMSLIFSACFGLPDCLTHIGCPWITKAGTPQALPSGLFGSCRCWHGDFHKPGKRKFSQHSFFHLP